MNTGPSFELLSFLASLRNGIWLLGISSWIFGIIDRSFASFADGYLSALDIVQLFTASFFFVSWLFLKPTSLRVLAARSTKEI
ncbi:hypothetical protein HJG54_07895 [Leptolyngbya sp. NK1-12]|uniref:Uncharacterized protein n=1 Tax=Leptolyngbya sp. NK1-12 TaxID=2547451 RepID=A0AA96WCX6_9CYAN|nr:hypothetical protein [Leptolyngbya sp. NK1-12]WNZ22783.1 hypothetical protein HJG54_07895 [Leptolyngbya sp. NK1-12]